MEIKHNKKIKKNPLCTTRDSKATYIFSRDAQYIGHRKLLAKNRVIDVLQIAK